MIMRIGVKMSARAMPFGLQATHCCPIFTYAESVLRQSKSAKKVFMSSKPHLLRKLSWVKSELHRKALKWLEK